MKDEMLQNYDSDVSMIEKSVTLYNCLNPHDYIIEFKNNGLLEQVVVLHDMEKAFFLFDSIRKSICYEIMIYENKQIIVK